MRYLLVVVASLGLFMTRAHDLQIQASAIQPAALDGAVRIVSPEAGRNVAIRIVDASTGAAVAGLIRFRDKAGNYIACESLLPRATGLTERDFGETMYGHLSSWYVLPGSEDVILPREAIDYEVFRGLESPLQRGTIPEALKSDGEIEIPCTAFFDREKAGLVAGNVHLHLQKMTEAEAEAYTVAIAAADGLDLAFFSYLERAEADEHYISNHFTPEDLERFQAKSGVLFGYGEEYRHNFIRNEGYGHVMFLDLWKPILPASFGQSIMKTGNDDGMLRPAIQEARGAGATVLWCHNTRGLEDIPSWIEGLLHGQIFFEQDGAAPGHDGYYSYLSIGLKVPLSTGTDWFFRDMAMTYVRTPRPFTQASWLADLRAGKSFMTNGPLIEFTVNGQSMGETVEFKEAGSVSVRARIAGRVDFHRLELLQNGEVIATAKSTTGPDYFEATLEQAIAVDQSCWLAVRIPPISVDYNRPKETPVAFNEYGKPLFAHSSPIYVQVDGQSVFVPDAARRLRMQVKADMATIKRIGDYSSEAERDKVLTVYDEALEKLTTMIGDSGLPE